MTEEVKNKLKEIYNTTFKIPLSIVQVFNEEYGEELVDNSLYSFDSFIEDLNKETLGSLGVTEFQDSNAYGTYKFSKEDYAKNGKGKPFTEYIPDLGIIDFLYNKLQSFIHLKRPNNHFSITVRFPEVTITNEENDSIKIEELYARVWITYDGKVSQYVNSSTGINGGLGLLRTKYNKTQWLAGYTHSHVTRDYANAIPYWKVPCLGRGPLRQTSNTLRETYDINIWGLFAFELHNYVSVESLEGIPYYKMRNIEAQNKIFYTLNNSLPISITNYLVPDKEDNLGKSLSRALIRDFIKHIINTESLSFSFNGENFSFSESDEEFALRISNSFIKWYNENKDTNDNIIKYYNHSSSFPLTSQFYSDGNSFYSHSSSENKGRNLQLQGRVVLNFKGEDIRLVIYDDEGNSNNNTITLLRPGVVSTIYIFLITLLNYNYVTKTQTKNRTEGRSVYI